MTDPGKQEFPKTGKIYIKTHMLCVMHKKIYEVYQAFSLNTYV